MKGKKGIWAFNAFFIVVMLIVIGAALVAVYAKTDISSRFGDLQKAILGTYDKGENILFYVDYAAKNSIHQAIYDLGQKGGFYETEYGHHLNTPNVHCEDYLGYTLLEGECFFSMDLLKQNLGLYLNDNLNNYLLAYPEEGIFIPQDNYDFLVKDDRIVGIATENIELGIKKAKEKEKFFEIITKKAEEAATKKAEEAMPKFEIATKPNIDIIRNYYGRLNSRSRIAGVVIDRVILHHTGSSTFSSGYNALKSRGLSVHYMVDRDGTIYHLVDEGRLAYHAKGWNARSIGIEMVNTGSKNMDYTNEQYKAVFNLVNDIVSRWPTISFDNEHIIGHYQASEIGKWDPSPNFDWAMMGLPGHDTLVALGKTPPKEAGYA